MDRGDRRGLAAAAATAVPDRMRVARRAAFTLGALGVATIGCLIPAPGDDLSGTRDVLEAGGPAFVMHLQLRLYSVLALWLTPFFAAWTLIQAALTAWPAAGRWARRPANLGRIETGAMIGALLMAALQAFGVASARENMGILAASQPFGPASYAAGLIGGVAFLIWLAGRIGAHGLGDGFLLLLATPIIANLPVRAWLVLRFMETDEFRAAWVVALVVTCVASLALLAFAASPTRARKADVVDSLARIDVWPIILAGLIVSYAFAGWLALPGAQLAFETDWRLIAVTALGAAAAIAAVTALRNRSDDDAERRRARWFLAAAQAVLWLAFSVFNILSGAPVLLLAQDFTILLAAAGTVLRDARATAA